MRIFILIIKKAEYDGRYFIGEVLLKNYCNVITAENRTDGVLDEIVPNLEKIYKRKQEAGFIELLMHEQYFYPDYCLYIADFENIILGASKWLTEHGYQGAFMSEVMF